MHWGSQRRNLRIQSSTTSTTLYTMPVCLSGPGVYLAGGGVTHVDEGVALRQPAAKLADPVGHRGQGHHAQERPPHLLHAQQVACTAYRCMLAPAQMSNTRVYTEIRKLKLGTVDSGTMHRKGPAPSARTAGSLHRTRSTLHNGLQDLKIGQRNRKGLHKQGHPAQEALAASARTAGSLRIICMQVNSYGEERAMHKEAACACSRYHAQHDSHAAVLHVETLSVA